MAMRLGFWQPEGKPARLYVNGIPGLGKYDKVWTDQNLWPAILTSGYVRDAQQDQAREFLRQWPTWHDALRAARGNPDSPSPDRAEFERAHIAHVSSAVRMVGIAFRNGLTKDAIIDRILSSGHAAQALQYVRQLQSGNIPKTEPLKPAPAADWITDDDAEPTPPPAPVQPPVTPKAPMGDYVTFPQLHDAVRPLNASIEELQVATTTAEGDIQSLRAKVAELQALRPVALHFPEKPQPIIINGLRHPQFEDLIKTLRAGCHAMLVGGAGSGKTTAARQAAEALGLTFYKATPFNYAHEVVGHLDAHSRLVITQTRQAYEKGGLLCLDEHDASAAEAGIHLNAILDDSPEACFPDGLIKRHLDFRAVLCTNTDGSGATMQFTGRQRQDGSTLDRVIPFEWEIDPRIEEQMANGALDWLAAVRAVRAFVAQRGILDVIATARATKFGAALLQTGMARPLILARTCKRGALRECWREVEALPAVAAFLRG